MQSQYHTTWHLLNISVCVRVCVCLEKERWRERRKEGEEYE